MQSRGNLCKVLFAFAFTSLCAPSWMAQEKKTDVTFQNTPVQIVIEQLARVLGKSVAFDSRLADHVINVDARDVTVKEELWQLLEDNGLYSVEVGDALYVGPDTMASRRNTSERRIEACTIHTDAKTKTDIVFRNTPVPQILTALAKSLGRPAVFEIGKDTARRTYSLELRGTTHAEAIAVMCLAWHLEVRTEQESLIFSEPSADR